MSLALRQRLPFALILLLLPIVVSAMAAVVVLVQGFGAPFSFWGDKAVEETAVQQAVQWERSFGAHSNYAFFHPGPLMFYLFSPFYGLTGNEPLAISVGALMVNTAGASGTIMVVDRLVGRAAATGASLVVMLYFWAWSGPGIWEHWNPALVPLALLFACTLWVGAWTGTWTWLLAGWLPASFVVQTHVGTLPLVLAAFLLGVTGATSSAWRRRRTTEACTQPWPRLITGALAVILVVVWLPPLWQQITAQGDDGNLERLVEVALSGPDLPPGTPKGWSLEQSWRAVANEATRVPFGWEPAPSPTLPVDLSDLRLPAARGLVWFTSLGVALGMVVWGVRAQRPVVVGLCAMTLATSIAAVLAAMRVPAELFNYQLWGSACSLLPAWIALGAVVTSSLHSRHVQLVLGAGTATSMVLALAFVANLDSPKAEPFGKQALAVAAHVRQEVGSERSVALAWDPALDAQATGIVATLRREGLDVKVPPERSFVFGDDLIATGTEEWRLLLAPTSTPEPVVVALQPSWVCPISNTGEAAGVEVWISSVRCPF